MSKFFDTHGIPTALGLKGFFEAVDEARTNEEYFMRQRDVEIAAKRMIEHAVRRANHVLRNIHTSRGKRLEQELVQATLLLEDARRLLADERGTK